MGSKASSPHPHPPRRGTILIVTLVLVFVLAALVITLAQWVRADAVVSANVAAAREATLVERGAEQYVLALLANAKANPNEPVEALDESYFMAVPIGEGYFWIVRPDYNDPLLPAFGLVDETSKIDLNTEGFERLMQLPGMTEQLAASIIDWRDADDESTQGYGAESSNYLGRSPGYTAKNAPFESVEELLLVEGMTRELLYGPADQPPLGVNNSIAGSADFATEHWQRRGWFDLFTVWSYVPMTAPDGRQRLDTDGDEDQLRELVTEIIGGSRAEEINQRLDDENNIFQFAQEAGITPEELRQLEPYLIGGDLDDGPIRGRINVNYAPREVLLAADEDASPEVVDQAITTRKAQTETYPGTMAWMMAAMPQAIAQLDDDVTARGTHYSADIVAVSGDGRAFRRVRIVVDTSTSEPTIVFRRDLTDGGWPLDPILLENLRNGFEPQ